MSTEEGKTAMDQLNAFRYGFNEKGEMRRINKKTNEMIHSPTNYIIVNRIVNKEWKELLTYLAAVMLDMIEAHGLKRTSVPVNLPLNPSCFFYSQPQSLSRSKKLLVLIHDNLMGNYGIWSSYAIIDKSLEHGSQLAYIRRAQQLGYDLLLIGDYENYRLVWGKKQPIEQLDNASSIIEYIWKRYVIDAQPESVAIIGCASAAQLVFDLATLEPEFFKAKVFAIGLMKAYYDNLPDDVSQIIGNYTCDWIKGGDPVNPTILGGFKTNTIRKRTVEVESPSDIPYATLDTIFRYLEEKFAEFKVKVEN